MEEIAISGDTTFYRDEQGQLQKIKTAHLKQYPDRRGIYAEKVTEGGKLLLKDDISDEAYLALFGLDRGRPYPYNEIVNGKRYSTDTAEFICRYTRISVGYEPNYRKWKKHGGARCRHTGELFRTAKGTWFALEVFEDGILGVSLKTSLGEEVVKKVIEDTIPERYEEFFTVEEA
jgi:hypothetical protein